MKAKSESKLVSVDWPWQDKRLAYDRSHVLTPTERYHLATLVRRFHSGQKGWHSGAAAALTRLTQPLYETLDYLGATTTEKRNRTVRNTAVCLIIRAMNRWELTYWGFSTQQWHELIGDDYYTYIELHGCTANARHQIIALAYLLCDFDDLWSIGRLSWPSIAAKIFSPHALMTSYQSVMAQLTGCGYTETGNAVAVKCAVAAVFLKARTCDLNKIPREVLLDLHQNAKAKITRRGLVLLSEILYRVGILSLTINRVDKALSREIKHKTVVNNVSPEWADMTQRWSILPLCSILQESVFCMPFCGPVDGLHRQILDQLRQKIGVGIPVSITLVMFYDGL